MMEALIQRLTEVVEFNARQLIDPDHELAVVCVAGSENLLFEITVVKSDVGLIIGSNGRHIEAIRTIVHGALRGARYRTDVEVTNSRQ